VPPTFLHADFIEAVAPMGQRNSYSAIVGLLIHQNITFSDGHSLEGKLAQA